jgi:hypothetical protein
MVRPAAGYDAAVRRPCSAATGSRPPDGSVSAGHGIEAPPAPAAGGADAPDHRSASPRPLRRAACSSRPAGTSTGHSAAPDRGDRLATVGCRHLRRGGASARIARIGGHVPGQRLADGILIRFDGVQQPSRPVRNGVPLSRERAPVHALCGLFGWQGHRSPTRANTLRCSACQRTAVAKSHVPIGSAVKAGEPCRGLAWRGEPESLDVGNFWPRKERGNLRVPRGARLRSPAHRVGRRPPPPGRGPGGVRPVAPTSKPESERTSYNAAPYDPARIVQGDEGVGVRIHQRLSVVGRTVEQPSPAGGLAGRRPRRPQRPVQRSREPRHRRARRVRCAARPVAPQPRAPPARVRPRDLPGPQHRRTRLLPAPPAPRRRHPVRQARLRLPRHRRRRRDPDLAPRPYTTRSTGRALVRPRCVGGVSGEPDTSRREPAPPERPVRDQRRHHANGQAADHGGGHWPDRVAQG